MQPTSTRARRLVAALFCLAPLAFPQTDANKGQILGSVFDANKSVVPNAKIKIKNLNTGFNREATSGSEGQYRLVQLDPGVYSLIAESSGFAPATFSGITVSVGSAVSLDVTLQELVRLGDGIEPHELERCKARAKSSLIMQQESTTSRAGSIARDWHFLKRVQTLDDIQREIDSLTVDSVLDYVRQHPARDFTVLTIGPNPLNGNAH